jgi:hypothetical protein
MKRWLFIGCCLTNFSLAAQNQINPVIQVERLYDADLIEVTKPLLDTTVPDSLRMSHMLIQYSILDKPLVNLYEFIPLPPAVVRSYENTGPRYGYINLGAGYPWTPRGDILLQAPMRSDWYIGLQARHRSLLDQDDTRMASDGRIMLEHRGSRNTFRVNILGEHLNNSFAIVDMLSVPALNNQNYYKAGVELETYSLNNAPGSWHYYWKSGYNHAKNRVTGSYDSLPVTRENILDLEAATGYILAKGFSLNLGAKARFASDRWMLDGVSASRAMVNVFPHVIWSGERYKAGVGLRVGYLLGDNDNKLGIFPWFDAHFTFVRDWLTLYARMNGYHLLNTYQDRMTENPWIFADQMYDATVPWDVQAGFTGTIGDLFHYRIYGAYRYTKNQFFFGTQVYQQGHPGLYILQYSDETRYTAGGSLTFHSRPFGMGISGEWHQYALNSGNPPWHKPVWNISGYARYNWRERIIVTATGCWRDACFAPDWKAVSPAVTIPGFLDLGIRLEYVINRMFSAYLMGSNLLNKDISYYYLYRNPGLTFGGGLTFRF